MSTQLHDESAVSRETEAFRKWKDFPMTPVVFVIVIVIVIFFAGFGVGYAAREWRSRKRKHMHQLYAPYGSSTSRSATRRAF